MTTKIAAKLVPPFTRETGIQKGRITENNWNSRNPRQVALAYTTDRLMPCVQVAL